MTGARVPVGGPTTCWRSEGGGDEGTCRVFQVCLATVSSEGGPSGRLLYGAPTTFVLVKDAGAAVEGPAR